MPGLSGADLHGQLIVRGHRIPVIFITGHPEDAARRSAIHGEAVCFLSKPYSAEELIGCIEQALKADA